jgi:hypothetical protein
MNSHQNNLPTTASKTGEAALTGVSHGFTDHLNNDGGFGKLIDFSRTGGLQGMIASGVQQSVSGGYPLYTCQTAGTGYNLYNELCFFHMNERDLQALSDYRKHTGEDLYTPNKLATVTQTTPMIGTGVP